MQMDSYYYASLHDDIPCFYPPSPEQLPFGLDDASPLVEQPPGTTEAPRDSAFRDYYYDAPADVITAGTQQGSGGQNVHRRVIDALGRMEVDRDQCAQASQGTGMEEEPRQPAGAVESSRGFRHMMRERQRREKLSQSYADLYAMVAARSKGDKNSIVQSAAVYIHELKGAREQLQRRNEELKAKILGHDARQPSVKVDFEVDDPASGIDSMIGALRRLKGMGVRARGIRSSLSGGRLWTEMNMETTIAACEAEKAVEEALMEEVERNQQQLDSSKAWCPRGAATHVQNVF